MNPQVDLVFPYQQKKIMGAHRSINEIIGFIGILSEVEKFFCSKIKEKKLVFSKIIQTTSKPFNINNCTHVHNNAGPGLSQPHQQCCRNNAARPSLPSPGQACKQASRGRAGGSRIGRWKYCASQSHH